MLSSVIFFGVGRFFMIFSAFFENYSGTAAVRTIFPGKHESAGTSEKRSLA
jgi:hypothetical protein